MHALYGSRDSRSAAVEAMLALAGLPCRCVRASTREVDSALQEQRRLNPVGLEAVFLRRWQG
jgi:hypothetical protein